jgi:uncharacterized SAM-binding protein YcdF (DUF218 family)
VFFYLSKIFWFAAAPLNLLFLLLAAAMLAGARGWRRFSRGLGGAALLLFLICGISPAGYDLLVLLESRYPPPLAAARPARADGAVILGGSFYTHVTQARGVPAVNDNAERVLAAAQLARLYPQAEIVFSGGYGRLAGKARPEAEDVRLFLDTYGIGGAHMRFEEKSRNTYENLKFARQMAQPRPGQRWLLVTSAWHMERAMRIARRLGWEMIPWPVDYRTTGRYRLLPPDCDIPGRFYETQLALHELAGIAIYRLTGKAD